ncbi:Hypothetical_protein [Hexamita inflata]|uniref:Hypothetical_protein n=1 Tax=Hexamita inflata TaxID=28002 RepID=A0AA86RFC0_9EUKA|nr:Hypothetical protein HINF_LOCUS33974 [Hexamita inflata]CAI9976936.1 Hypothetical protein HINF_LOCUS64581 [Hexamita inflata]
MKTSSSKYQLNIPSVLQQIWNTELTLQSKQNSVKIFEALQSGKSVNSTSSACYSTSADSIQIKCSGSYESLVSCIQHQTKAVQKMSKRTSQIEERLTQIVEVNVSSLKENNTRIIAQISRLL